MLHQFQMQEHDQLINLPASSVSLNGSGTDADGTISSYNWTKISGPSSGIITNANAASTTVTSLVQGVYQFQLKVTDNKGAIGLDTMQVTVNAPPISNAGADQLINLPTNTVSYRKRNRCRWNDISIQLDQAFRLSLHPVRLPMLMPLQQP